MPNDAGNVEVEVFPAGHGDAILVRCSSAGASFNVLIDGGIRGTYGGHLAGRLSELHAAGERLDVVVVSHIDNDHIAGVLELLEANGPSNKPGVIAIGDIWHNGYRHLGLKGRPPTDLERKSVLSQVPVSGDLTREPGAISVREAETLASLITKFGYWWNKAFDSGPVIAGATVKPLPNIKITLLSPNAEALQRLAYNWKRGLLTKGVSHEAVHCPEFEAAFELEMPQIADTDDSEVGPISSTDLSTVPDPSTFKEDDSTINGSSIALLLECFGRRLLFLADAWPSIIVQEWQKALGASDSGSVDVLKVSHHASRRNTSPELVGTIRSKTYIVSTDGTKHGHPHAEALLRIIGAGGPGATLVFNYPTDVASRLEQEALKDKFGHTVRIGTGDRSVIVAPGVGGQLG